MTIDDGMCFFFSSRRRHTRYWRDWSSDVCSSDLLGGDVLPVAAAAAPGPAVRAGPRHPVGRGLEHLDGVGAAEPGLAVLGDPDDDPFPGQRVPHEHDTTLVAGHAVPPPRPRAPGVPPPPPRPASWP